MQFEKASVEPAELDALAVDVLDPERVGLPEDPQAASASAQTTAIEAGLRR
jgi:hypothetical protein